MISIVAAILAAFLALSGAGASIQLATPTPQIAPVQNPGISTHLPNAVGIGAPG
jgi:hypothetical protein